MKYYQIIMRIETAIVKDKQKIVGYRLANYNSNSKRYDRHILLMERTIKRKEEALVWLKAHPKVEYEWTSLCKQFKIRRY